MGTKSFTFIVGVEDGEMTLSGMVENSEGGISRFTDRFSEPEEFKKAIRALGDHTVYCSSSVDFPEEYGMTAERLAEFIG